MFSGNQQRKAFLAELSVVVVVMLGIVASIGIGSISSVGLLVRREAARLTTLMRTQPVDVVTLGEALTGVPAKPGATPTAGLALK